ncbi:MAG: hypothetical protein GXO04_05970 [Aquificae bacterium]|nr:hypothetical protein [Aquificota bacterium]
MTEKTRTGIGLRDISIRLVSEMPVLLTGGFVYCEYGMPVRYLKVDENEAKLEISVEKMRRFAKVCKDVNLFVDNVLKEVNYALPEAVFTVVKVYADGVKIRELSYLEENTPIGRGIIIDENRQPEQDIPLHARENRDKIFNTLREIILLELLFTSKI